MREHKFLYFFHEGLSNMFSHGFMSFAAIGTTVACLLIMGTFTLVAVNADENLKQMESENEILAYVEDTYTEEEARRLGKLLEVLPNVASVEFITREQAMESFVEDYPEEELFQDLDPNILRDRFAIRVKDLNELSETKKQVEAVKGIARVNAYEAVAGGFTLIDGRGVSLPDRRKYGIVRPRQLRQLGITGAPFSKVFGFDKAPAPLLCRNFAPGCTVLFSSRVRSLYLQSTQAKAPHDWEILLIAQLLDGLYYLNAPTIRYRLHDHNTIGIPNAAPIHGPSKSGRERVMDYYESIFHTFDGILRRVRSQPLPPRFLEYAALRRDALSNCRLASWLRLWNYRDIYHTMFPFRQRMGDLVFILTKRGDRS